MGDQDKDFGAVSQTDLTRSLVSSVAQANLRPSTKSRFKLEMYEILQKKKNSQRSVVSSDEIVLSHYRVLMERILLTNEVWLWNLLRKRQAQGALML